MKAISLLLLASCATILFSTPSEAIGLSCKAKIKALASVGGPTGATVNVCVKAALPLDVLQCLSVTNLNLNAVASLAVGVGNLDLLVGANVQLNTWLQLLTCCQSSGITANVNVFAPLLLNVGK